MAVVTSIFYFGLLLSIIHKNKFHNSDTQLSSCQFFFLSAMEEIDDSWSRRRALCFVQRN